MSTPGLLLTLAFAHVGSAALLLSSHRTRESCPAPVAQLGVVQSFPCSSSPKTSVAEESKLVFAYGSNLVCRKFIELGMEPEYAKAAYVPGMVLRFGGAPGVPTSPAEPGYGNLVASDTGCVHGLVHRIPLSQLPILTKTEPGYALEELPDVIGYDGQRISGVYAYIMKGRFTQHRPSRRYAGLLKCASEQVLAQGYTQMLAEHLASKGLSCLNCTREEFLPLPQTTPRPGLVA